MIFSDPEVPEETQKENDIEFAYHVYQNPNFKDLWYALNVSHCHFHVGIHRVYIFPKSLRTCIIYIIKNKEILYFKLFVLTIEISTASNYLFTKFGSSVKLQCKS